MKLASPAKINLFLNVIGKNEDNYHLLESVFSPISVTDEIEIAESDQITCRVNNFDIKNNTVIRAAELLKSTYNVDGGATISINKNIPIGAGLGGGSSNAATTLKILNSLWALNLSNERLCELGLQIGADVPFFIKSETAFVQGVGEIITPIRLGLKLPILVIYPNTHSTTKEVFELGLEKYSLPLPSNEKIVSEILNGKNDLFKNAIKLNPVISNVIEWLKSQKGVRTSRMSGTGSACFAIFEDSNAAELALALVPSKWWKHYELLSL